MKKLFFILTLIFLASSLQAAELPPSRARQIRTDTANFDINLSSADTTVQKALDTLDDMAGGGESTTVSDSATINLILTGTNITADLIEAGAEAILDLQDLQGAVTDAQVPDNITITEVDGSITNEINTITLPDANVTAGVGITFTQAGSIAITESVADTVLFTVTETDPSALLTAGTDNVKDTHIDWGIGASQVNPADFVDQDIGDITITTGAWAVENDSHTHGAGTITEADPNVDTEAEIEAITGALFGASKVVTGGYVWVADGIDFESVLMSGDVSIASGGVTTVADESHAHTTTTISGLDISADTNLTAGDALTLTDDDIDFDGGAAPGGELGGTWASPTIDDSLAVTSWNLTTPTITTSLTTSTPTTLTAAELDRLDGLTSPIIDDDKIDTFAELDAIVANKALVNKADGAVWLGIHDFGGATSVEVPNGAADVVLANGGELHLNTTDEQLSFHSAADGEISGEVAISLLSHIAVAFDPDAICDGAVDRVFIGTVGDDFPEGITIVEWQISFEADPTTEADLDLKRADAFIGVANAAVMDVLDTLSGVASEDTAANINGGAVVANGQDLYLEFGTAYTETGHQVIFQMWFYGMES